MSILRKVDANWLEGTLNDKKGIFPAAYVEMAEGMGRGIICVERCDVGVVKMWVCTCQWWLISQVLHALA